MTLLDLRAAIRSEITQFMAETVKWARLRSIATRYLWRQVSGCLAELTTGVSAAL
jgi:hypothetical protein